jgi:hypothetical protein
MTFAELAQQVAELISGSRSVYMRTDPEYPDFTAKSEFKISISNLRNRVEVQISPKNVVQIIALFDATIFDKEQIAHLYTWNFKALATYFRAFCESSKFVTPINSLIDLKTIEGFLGIKKTAPENLVEAINRTKVATQIKGWQQTYKNIHLPLLLRVLPTIETTGLLNERTRKAQYPCYEIEGQINGRMNCQDKYASCYLPHTMGADIKGVLKPEGHGWRFISADFRYCEVVVLQWLSKDETLKQILDSGEDLHSKIYEIVTEDKCDTANKRALSKRMFLPVMYGCGPKTLGTNLGVGEAMGQELFKRIQVRFPTALAWLHARQGEAKHGVVYDYFGRPRQFAEGESYKARNFHVQAVAATFCQEKLIDLWRVVDGDNLRLVFSVHDGYGLICQLSVVKQAYRTVKDTLETESKFCPGLKLSVEIKFGARLDNMKVFWKD